LAFSGFIVSQSELYILYFGEEEHEKNISAKQQKEKKQTRLYEEKCVCSGEKGFVFKKKKGAQKTHRFLTLLQNES